MPETNIDDKTLGYLADRQTDAVVAFVRSQYSFVSIPPPYVAELRRLLVEAARAFFHPEVPRA